MGSLIRMHNPALQLDKAKNENGNERDDYAQTVFTYKGKQRRKLSQRLKNAYQNSHIQIDVPYGSDYSTVPAEVRNGITAVFFFNRFP